ncbi:MAG: hypothetical protein ACI4HI_06035 [Lachnospiraceae bacterium]
MDRLQDYINIDRRFQNSVNLKLDFGKEERRDSYIPTRSSVLVLRHYLEHVVEKKEQATILIGPYGKGKSHLLLVLLSLLHAKDEVECATLLKKIEVVDAACATLICRRFAEQKPYLPVFISATQETLQQSFLYGMREALKREGLESLAPDSYYSEALRVLQEWKTTYPSTYHQFSQLLQETKQQTCETLMQALQQSTAEAKEAYRLFCSLYPKVTAGATFSPLIQLDPLTIYASINRTLCEEYGYGGIYIVFDEFSKYVENQKKETFSGDMKVLQDLCELAQNSREYPLHLTMVAHKSIREYGSQLPEEMRNAYVGVEGRIHEEYFLVSAQNQYELIANVIQKKKQPWKKDPQAGLWQMTVNESYEKIPVFYSMFSRKEFEKIVAKGCYPLLPLTACVLLAISEKVAQNERSVFTFLANEESESLLLRIRKKKPDEAWTIGVDAVYDYFYPLFRENTQQVRIHTEWLKADYALQKAETVEEKRLLKAIALLRMLNRPEEIPVQDETLRLSLAMTPEVYTKTRDALQKKQLIQYRARRNTYAFKNNVGLDLEKEIRLRMEKESVENQTSRLLTDVFEQTYCLPKQYNLDYTMTRFFQYVFFSVEQFRALADSEELFRKEPADGKILALYWKNKPDEGEIETLVKKLDDPRLVVLVPDTPFALQEKLKRYLVVKRLLSDPTFLEENRVLQQELELHLEDLLYTINEELEQQYRPQRQHCRVFDRNGKQRPFSTEIAFNRYLSEVCTSCYEKAPRINHEMINRRTVSAQMKKARKHLVRQMLEEADCAAYQKGTSPEATIYRATLYRTGVWSGDASIPLEEGCEIILQRIYEFMQKSVGKKQCFAQLYHTLEGVGTGARRGVLPFFLARQFAGLNDLPVLYLQDKEVELSEEILENINERPEDYYLYMETSSAQKEAYLNGLQEVFVENGMCKRGTTKRQRLQEIVESMQIFLRSLPQYTLTFQEFPEGFAPTDFTMAQLQVFRKALHPMELNPHEILFETLPKQMELEDYSALLDCIRAMRIYLKQFLNQIEQAVAGEVKQIFGARKEESLLRCLKDWYATVQENVRCQVLSDPATRLVQCLENLQTNDEHESIKRLSKAVLDLYPEDWKDISGRQFLAQFKQIKTQLEHIQKAEAVGQKHISFTGEDGKQIEKYYDAQEDSTSEFLSNAIEEALDEFGDTLEINQKVSVLVQALERLVKG